MLERALIWSSVLAVRLRACDLGQVPFLGSNTLFINELIWVDLRCVKWQLLLLNSALPLCSKVLELLVECVFPQVPALGLFL